MATRRRAEYQTEKDRAGRVVGYRKQVLHPITGERLDLRGKTAAEVMGRADDVHRLKRDIAAGLVTYDQAQERLSRAQAGLQALGVPALWASYLRRLDVEWRTKSGGEGHSTWAAKVRGIGDLYVLPSTMLGRYSVFDLTFDTMTKWAEKVLERVGEKSLQNVFYCLTAAVRDLVRARKLSSFPWGDFVVKVSASSKEVGRGRGKVRDGDEFARLMAAARAEDAETRATSKRLPDLAARLGLMTALCQRRGEAIALAWDCVRELPSGDIQVDIRFQAQEGWRRQLPQGKPVELARPCAPPKADSVGSLSFGRGTLTARLLAEQRALVQARGLYRDAGPVFPDKRGAFRARSCIEPYVMRRLARAAGLSDADKYVQHSTRHSGATLLLSAGISPREAMLITRHKNIETFGGYIAETGRSNVRLPDSLGLEVARAPMLEASAAQGGSIVHDAEPWPPMLEVDPSPVRLVAKGGVVIDTTAILSVPAGEAEENRRRYHEKSLGHRVGDFAGEAFREWLAMGQPMRREKVKLDRNAIPATVIQSAVAAAKRAQEKARRVPGATKEALESARKIGFSRTCNAWEQIRRRGVVREINEGRGAALRTEVLLDVLAWRDDQREKLGLKKWPAELMKMLPAKTSGEAKRLPKRAAG